MEATQLAIERRFKATTRRHLGWHSDHYPVAQCGVIEAVACLRPVVGDHAHPVDQLVVVGGDEAASAVSAQLLGIVEAKSRRIALQQPNLKGSYNL